MKKVRIVSVIFTLILVSGCSTMTPARYSMSVDNNQALKQYAGAAIKVASIEAAGKYDSNCRLMGPIKASDNMTIPQFVEKAFNDEFKLANVYSENGVLLTGKLTKIAFSSVNGLTNGVWSLDLSLASSNGKSLSIASQYNFKSGFDAITACNQTAQALTPAVQDLIKKTILDPKFSELIKQ